MTIHLDTSSPHKRRFFCWALWVQWTLATAAGGTLAGLIAALFRNGSLLVAAPGSLILVGLIQARLLRHLIPSALRWALISAIAGACGWCIGLLSSVVVAGILAATGLLVQGTSDLAIILRSIIIGGISGVIAGMVVGYAQQSMVRLAVPQVRSWVRASMLAWGLTHTLHTMFLGLLEGQIGKLAFTAMAPVFSASIQWIILMTCIWGLGWLLNGAVTGMVLARARAQLVLEHAA